MWVVAGVLFGLVVLTSLVGFHLGPHAHAAAGLLAVAVAAWLAFMAVEGRAAPVLWALLGADLVVGGGAAALGWSGLSGRWSSHRVPSARMGAVGHPSFPEGAEGIAVGDLDPEGIVQVRGEQWSAVSVNGNVSSGARVQVLRADGVHLDVWGEDPEGLPPGWTSLPDQGEKKERYS